MVTVRLTVVPVVMAPMIVGLAAGMVAARWVELRRRMVHGLAMVVAAAMGSRPTRHQ